MRTRFSLRVRERISTQTAKRVCPRAYVPALSLVLAGLLGGCGGGGSSSTAREGAPFSFASTSAVDAVAVIAGKPITGTSYAHWLRIERALGASGNVNSQTLGFLITSEWLVDEAAAQQISVSQAEVKRRFDQLKKKSFPEAGSLQRYLKKSHESEADLRGRVKSELFESRIASKVTAGKSPAQRKTALSNFQRAFQQRWKRHTTCKAGYVMEDCSEYHSQPEKPTATSSSFHRSRSSSSNSSSELPPPPAGSMAITSPAFERDQWIPARYTCDGADVSPPLRWQNVPIKAASLVLFIIDDTSTGSASGIRWIVGDIDPHSKGVAVGAVPEGAIVGSDTQGHTGYGGICPPRGKTSTIEFVLYALSRKIKLSSGFQPALAESEYGGGRLLLDQAATTYAVYHRP